MKANYLNMWDITSFISNIFLNFKIVRVSMTLDWNMIYVTVRLNMRGDQKQLVILNIMELQNCSHVNNIIW